ncbi:MAG TPA: ABC transporter ATP-binding protein [Gemmatimonadales bacterium]|jgi:lipoprotein-releasing system ATP-binding protein|nr:ABC transporter ATP-binding protein [Gemmatimonadales bacterium]
MSAVLEARALRKTFRGGDGSLIEVLAGVDLSVSRGEFVAIMGVSGAGKSTLLHLLGALELPTSGEVQLEGVSFAQRSATELAEVRNRKVGFVFQFHHLLREFSALENVMMPLLIAGRDESAARSRAEELLAAVGLAGRMTHRPAQLSGGEQQRVAVARALVNDPVIVLADEPSGNLDQFNGERLHQLFATLSREFETALVAVTHNPMLAARADRVMTLEAGHLVPHAGVESLPS